MTNIWVEKSIEIANSDGYLDNLSEVYTSELMPRRPLEPEDKRIVEELHSQNQSEQLLKFLLSLTKKRHPFPIEHPYASIFRQKSELIDKNPKILEKLENVIMNMSANDIIRGCERRIDLNRVLGQAFQKWLKAKFSNKIPFLSEHMFNKTNSNAFLDAKDAKILKYLNENLGYDSSRGRDFLYKSKNIYAVGEARFLSTAGGSQNRDLNETIQFIKQLKGNVMGVGVVDGIIWSNRSYVKKLRSLGENEPVLTVLLLEDFLESI